MIVSSKKMVSLRYLFLVGKITVTRDVQQNHTSFSGFYQGESPYSQTVTMETTKQTNKLYSNCTAEKL